jgi:GPH family glycoside/pentoside/hexuronide:cation symporter
VQAAEPSERIRAGAPEANAPATPGPAAGAPRERLPLGVKLAYGLPSIAGAAMAIPIGIHMTKFYSDNVGVALGYIALGQAVARAFDAISDPLMGWISDRTRSRWGRRRPWIAIGAPLAAIFFVALFAPPEGIGPLTGAAWFTASVFLFFVLNTIYEIPRYGLGAELTSDYHERTSLFAWRDGAVLLGTMLGSALPSLVVLALVRRGVDRAAAERAAYFWFALAFAALMVLLYAWLVVRVRENPEYARRPPNPLVPGVRRVLRNRPFRILLLCYLATSVTGAIPGIFLPYYLHYVIGLEDWSVQMGPLLMVYFGSGFVSIPGWLKLTHRFGKRDVWVWHYVVGISASLSLYFLPVFVTGSAALPPLYAILLWAGVGFGSGALLAPSMQADVIDYDELYTGRRREAQFGALWGIATKFAVIPSASIPLAILAAVGFVPNQVQSENVVWTIRLIDGIAPATMAGLAMLLAVRFPITERIHRAVLEGIEAHKRGESAVDPLTGKLLPPPGGRGVDEETGWFLDHFSPGELRRALASGARTLRRDSVRALGGALLTSVAIVAIAVASVEDWNTEPSAAAVIGVPFAGLALAGACFHALRIRAARRAEREGLSRESVTAHLESALRFRQRPGR